MLPRLKAHHTHIDMYECCRNLVSIYVMERVAGETVYVCQNIWFRFLLLRNEIRSPLAMLFTGRKAHHPGYSAAPGGLRARGPARKWELKERQQNHGKCVVCLLCVFVCLFCIFFGCLFCVFSPHLVWGSNYFDVCRPAPAACSSVAQTFWTH